MNYLYNGFTIVIYNKEIIALETKAIIDRGVTEPTSEPTIKGPKDAFNENYNTNIGLIRKRLKTEKNHSQLYNRKNRLSAGCGWACFYW